MGNKDILNLDSKCLVFVCLKKVIVKENPTIFLVIKEKNIRFSIIRLLNDLDIPYLETDFEKVGDVGIFLFCPDSLKEFFSIKSQKPKESQILLLFEQQKEVDGLEYDSHFDDLLKLPAFSWELSLKLKRLKKFINLSRDMSLYRFAFHEFPDVISINRIKDGLFYDVNKGFCEITGYSKEEVIGKTSLDVNIWADPRDRDRMLGILKKRGRVKNFEAKYRLKGGKISSGLMSCKLIHIGNEAYTLSVTKDIEGLKKIQEQLEKSEKLLKEAQRIAGFGCWELDIVNNKLYWSDEVYRIFEIPKTDFGATYEAFLERVHPDDRKLVDKAYTDSLRTRRPYKIEHRLLMPDGRIKWMQEQCETTFDNDGRPVRSIGTVLDITDRKLFEKELEKHKEELEQKVRERTKELEFLNKELESFSFSVSHDLKAPLRAINGFSKILYEDHRKALDDDAKRLLMLIRENSQKMASLIDDLLNFSRVTRKSIKHSKIYMKALAIAIFNEIASKKEKERIRFKVNELPVAWADLALMKRVFHNLISNAIKFTGTRSSPSIEIGYKETKYGSAYFVKDNGVGFDPKYTHRLFDIFQRLHPQREFPGTGVGLSIVRRIINRHGGRVWAESQKGKGAIFYFTLAKKGL